MEKIITVVINFICFILMITMINDYADSFILIVFALLTIFLCYLLFKFRKKYISKEVLIIHFSGILLQLILLYLFDAFDIWKVSNGFMGLGAGSLGVFLYFCISIIFLCMGIIINIFKYIINKANNK